MKRVLWIFIVLYLVIVGAIDVSAATLSIDDIVASIKNESFKEIDVLQFMDNTTVSKDDNNIKYHYKKDSIDFTSSFAYADGVLTYTAPTIDEFTDAVISQLNIDSMWSLNLLYNVSLLKGYSKETAIKFLSEYEYDNTQSVTGLNYDLEKYNYDGDGSSASGQYAKLFKIDTNTFKIPDKYIVKDASSTPKISFENITKNSLDVKFSANIEDATCTIFRSPDNENYTAIATNLSCKEERTYHDINLESGKEYYYMIMEESSKASDVKKIRTANVDGSGVVNPQTGITSSLLILFIPLTAFALLIYIFKKNDCFINFKY